MIRRALYGAKFRGRMLIGSLALVFLATAGAIGWYYMRQAAAMEEQVVHELRAVSDTKTAQIVNWRNERLGDGHVLMSSPLTRISERILAGKGSDGDTATLNEVLHRFEEAFLYTGGVLCDLDGNARLISGAAATDPRRLRDLARQAVGATDSQLSDLRLDPQSGRPLMALIIPAGKDGALILDIDPQRFLYPYLRTWSGHSQSSESLLVRRDGDSVLYLSELRYHDSAPLRFSRSLKGIVLPSEAAMAAGVVFPANDYHGSPAIAVLRHVPDSPWYIVVKMDTAEADAPERRLGWEIAIITGLIALLNVTGAIVVWRGRSARLQQERLDWFRAIANDTPAYLWMADPKMENSFLNVPLAKYLGTGETHLRDAWIAAIHPDDAAEARTIFEDGMKNHAGYTQEYRVRRFDGEYRLVVSKATPRFSPEGVFLGMAGSMLDVTGRRMAEKQLREANENLQILSSRLIGAQEEERKRLARELHDDLSQQIAALSIGTGNLKRQIPKEFAEARAHADTIHHKLVNLAEVVRRMSHELHPAVLQYSGLAPALRSYCEEFGALSGLQIALTIDGAFEGVAPDAALCLFRVAQEALRNVAKHAGVKKASVQLQRSGGVLRLTVSDEGVGMAPGRAEAKAGLGLLNIQERARLVGGKVEIRSAPGQGTSITVEVKG